jgi:pimeloyl-ACP methyl ester carboxylesterase
VQGWRSVPAVSLPCCNLGVMISGRWVTRVGPLVALSAGLLAGAAFAQPQPAGLTASHSSGQTFITWQERRELTGERYRIYRHTVPISVNTLATATRLAEVGKGSGRFYADRYTTGDGAWRARYLDRYVITDDAPPLPTGTGLFVWTLAAQDFGGTLRGAGFYAVTTVSAAGVEDTHEFSPGNSIGPVAERIADPRPVEVDVPGNGGGHVYIQYMDLRHWNATFHAPNAGNRFYGLDPADPSFAASLQYAYTYSVGEPDRAACGDAKPAKAPLLVSLHGWGGNVYPPALGPTQHLCAFELRPVDVSETWWFGFAARHDFRLDQTPTAPDTVANFTERRVLRMVYDLLRDPALGPRLDPERVYVYGHSMGGSGALAFAMRYPTVFAAAYANEPMSNYRTAGEAGGEDWRPDVRRKWGEETLNLAVEIGAPAGWAQRLARYDGTGVWDWQNHQANLASRAGDEMAPFGVAAGRADTVLEWATQGRPLFAALASARRCWAGAITGAGHAWLGWIGLPPGLQSDDSGAPFAGLRARVDESVPGLANLSGDPPLPPPAGGTNIAYNQAVEWSASWHSWDGAPLDEPQAWRVSLRTIDGSTRTVDVTPRRLQRFSIAPGAHLAWENRRVGDGGLVASGGVAANAAGLVTVPAFRVTPGGNRLRLTPAPRRSRPGAAR